MADNENTKDMAKLKEEFFAEAFDENLFSLLFTIVARIPGYLFFMGFAQNNCTKEHFTSFKIVVKITDVCWKHLPGHDDPLSLVYENHLKLLDGRPNTRIAMTRLLQFLNKVPSCLIDALKAVATFRDSTPYLNILAGELIFLFQESGDLTRSRSFEVAIAKLIKLLTDLHFAAPDNRFYEFLFLIRNNFLNEVSDFHIFATFYIGFAGPRLAQFNSGNNDFEIVKTNEILSRLGDEASRREGNPKDMFDSLIEFADIDLPYNDVFA